MSKSTRLKSLRYLALFGACVAVTNACDRPSYTYADDVPVSGGTTFGGSFPAGKAAIGGGPALDPCALDRSVSASPILAKQVVSNGLAARTELYAEVTDSEVTALKKGGSLIPPPAPLGSVVPLSAVLTGVLSSPDPMRVALAQQLISRFKGTRSAWPNPWALRLVDHVGTEHMTPLRIRLKAEAWLARIEPGLPMVVVDVHNGAIALEQAFAHPERIAAVYYVYNDRVGDASALNNPLGQCEGGKREFALGNEAMVAEFSLDTPDILARLNSDIADLTGLFNVVRQCPTVDRGTESFHSATACQAWDFFEASTEYSAYQWSLSNPVELYKPTTQNLASLIDALKNDRFEPDPFVAASPSAGGDAGIGGEGGAGGAPDLTPGGATQGGAP